MTCHMMCVIRSLQREITAGSSFNLFYKIPDKCGIKPFRQLIAYSINIEQAINSHPKYEIYNINHC